MLIFFDTEFEGLFKDAKLISMGLISNNNKKLYIEFNDIDVDIQDTWIQDNILSNTIHYGNLKLEDLDKDIEYICGNKDQIVEKLVDWLLQFDEQITFVSDVGHYDFVFLIDLFGSAFDLPKFINPCYYDINQDISKHYGYTLGEAFDKSREGILKQYDVNITGEKHNSFYDAKVIKELYVLMK